jgi:hypothetical protein
VAIVLSSGGNILVCPPAAGWVNASFILDKLGRLVNTEPVQYRQEALDGNGYRYPILWYSERAWI